LREVQLAIYSTAEGRKFDGLSCSMGHSPRGPTRNTGLPPNSTPMREEQRDALQQDTHVLFSEIRNFFFFLNNLTSKGSLVFVH